MSIDSLSKFGDELSEFARSFEGVTRETIIKPLKRKGPKKADGSVPAGGEGISVLVVQTVDGIVMNVGPEDVRRSSLITAEDALEIAHRRLDKALSGGLRN